MADKQVVRMNKDQLDQIKREVSEVFDRRGISDEQAVALLLMFGASLGALCNMPCAGLLSTTQLAYDFATNRPDAVQRAEERLQASRERES